MSPLMQVLYEYVSSHYMWSCIDPQEHAYAAGCLTRLEDRLKASLQGKDKQAFQSCLDMAMEFNNMESEAMFQAAFAAAKELSQPSSGASAFLAEDFAAAFFAAGFFAAVFFAEAAFAVLAAVFFTAGFFSTGASSSAGGSSPSFLAAKRG